MEILNFEEYTTIADYMYDEADNGQNVTATLFFDDAVNLMKELIAYECVVVGAIDIAKSEYNGYTKEYYVTLSEDMVMDISPAWNGRIYLNAEPDIMLIDGNASSAIIRNVPLENCKEIYINDTSCECDCICSDCECQKDFEDVHNFKVTFSLKDILDSLFE